MIHYKKLKKSRDGMPTWCSLIPVVLGMISTKESWKGIQLKRGAIEGIVQLPADIKDKKHKDTDYMTILEHRAGFALSTLLMDIH